MITGGWGFVAAAYTMSWAALALYGLSLRARLRRAAPNATTTGENP